jgi:high-affinity Fe2+/Pb2+ permease
MSPDTLLTKIEDGIVVPFIYLMLAISAIFFVWGVFQFVRSSDNPEGQTKGKQHMIWGVIGLAIMLAVNSIIDLIDNTVN